jgi:hypothetical protein
MTKLVQTRVKTFAVAAAVGLAIHTAVAVDVRVDFNKTFDFKSVRTWAWNPQGPGEVRMARTADDDPEAMRKRAEPLILEAMAAEMSRRGLQTATEQPDLTATYYLLLTNSMSRHTLGQFLPATTEWGLPPFTGATQSLEVMNQGSLVLDMAAKGKLVWRGVAEAQLKIDADDKKRESVLREAVRDLVRRIPRDN